MAYTTIDKPTDYFNTIIYTGDGTTKTITGVGFQPDFVWGKGRNSSSEHALIDSVRGVTKKIASNSTGAEVTNATSYLTGFTSDGYTVDSTSNFNVNTRTQVNWNWLAGTSFTNDASATGIGSIDSAGSASDVSGFSIVSFTGTGSNGTIKHGLSTAPSMVIIKRTDSANDWRVGSDGLTNWTKHINLNTTAAQSDLAVAFNSTAPTSSVFSVGTSPSTNASGGTFIAYCFASINGYSKIGGSYTGNGNADGTFVYTGFKPAFVIFKVTSTTASWVMNDNKRNTSNVVDKFLIPNLSNAESTLSTVDFLSNGFKLRTTDSSWNQSGASYIYMAFAENPFVTGASAIPTTAR
jgi:hypothetical protein